MTFPVRRPLGASSRRVLLAWVTALVTASGPSVARAEDEDPDAGGDAPVASPRTQPDPWWGRDKALHLGVSATLSAGFYGIGAAFLDAPEERALFGGGVALGLGGLKELYDFASGDGDPSWRDFTWNVVGVAAGLVLSITIDLLVRALRASESGATAPSPDERPP